MVCVVCGFSKRDYLQLVLLGLDIGPAIEVAIALALSRLWDFGVYEEFVSVFCFGLQGLLIGAHNHGPVVRSKGVGAAVTCDVQGQGGRFGLERVQSLRRLPSETVTVLLGL